MFAYSQCKEWLKRATQRVAAADYEITASENKTNPATVRFRFKGVKAIGEVVVWENGATSMILYDLTLDKYTIDRHDLVLVDDNYDELVKFFDELLKIK